MFPAIGKLVRGKGEGAIGFCAQGGFRNPAAVPGGPRSVAAARTMCSCHAPVDPCGHGPDGAGPDAATRFLTCPKAGISLPAAVEGGGRMAWRRPAGREPAVGWGSHPVGIAVAWGKIAKNANVSRSCKCAGDRGRGGKQKSRDASTKRRGGVPAGKADRIRPGAPWR